MWIGSRTVCWRNEPVLCSGPAITVEHSLLCAKDSSRIRELGHRLLIATDQHQLIQDYATPTSADVDQSVSVADRLLGRYGQGQIASLSFDKGFTRQQDRELLELYIPQVVMPKRGKKTEAQAAAESARKFVALRRAHSAVESDINALEHHGLDRCLDVGMEGYTRYVGYGVLAYNLHVIGRRLLARGWVARPTLEC